jgi:hypothetical protein
MSKGVPLLLGDLNSDKLTADVDGVPIIVGVPGLAERLISYLTMNFFYVQSRHRVLEAGVILYDTERSMC